MDMLGNSQWREAILQYYENSGDPKAVFEVIKMSQEKETTDRGNDGFNYMLFGKKRCVCVRACVRVCVRVCVRACVCRKNWDTTLSICRMCLCNKAFTLFAN